MEIGDPEAIETRDDADFLKEIGASISTELASRELADLAFMGRREASEIHADLAAAIAENNAWKMAAHADAGLGRVARALIPIESAMREYEGLPAMRRRWENLQDSLEIRRQYGMLWRTVLRIGQPTVEEIPDALRKIANRIAILRRLKIYPFLRIDDRLAIRRLQKRILAALENADDRVSALRLWSDLVGFFGLLMQVNQRQGLREHDRGVVLSVAHQLSRAAARGDAIPPAALERLEPLLGRDTALDRILLDPASYRPEDCLEPLERLKHELPGGGTESALGQRRD